MRWIYQLYMVCLLNFGNLKARLDSSLVAVIGFTGVIMVFVAVFAIRDGFDSTLRESGSPDVAVVLRGGAGAEVNSVLSVNDAKQVASAPGIKAGANGPVTSNELLVQLSMPKIDSGTDANVPFRGVDAAAFLVHDKVRVVEGRNFQPGLNEVIVGVRASHEYKGLHLNDVIHSGPYQWKVVGLFDDGGVYASEVWGDITVMQSAYKRGSSLESVYVKLTTPGDLQQFKDFLTSDPQLTVSVERETEFYAEQSKAMNAFITYAGAFIALLMGIGAIFGAVNTMYNSVSSRAAEIATLRALGFGRSPVLLSVLVEGMLLGLIGGSIGGILAYVMFNGIETSTMGSNFAQLAFSFRVTPALLVEGAIFALLMGLLGGLLPAIRAVRMPIASSLRQL
ncbi:MAG TPA: ABC transporter permease [Gammaproteobacteria bacterium]|jgi:putative ABC transport system permease protein|nr:ABC transporter permease [Gammaproteobacteria bacterium]